MEKPVIRPRGRTLMAITGSDDKIATITSDTDDFQMRDEESMIREMLGDLDDCDGAKVSVDQLSSRLKGWLALLEGTGSDQAWIDALRSLRNELEVVSELFIESGRSELSQNEWRQLREIIGELREALGVNDDDVAAALNAFRAHVEPRDGQGDNPFKLACSFDRPATDAEIASAWPDGQVPGELVEAWLTSRQTRLFEDVDHGQWGLVLLLPADAATRTAAECLRRPTAYRADDVVIGEFLGDQELLVIAPAEANRGQVLIALPLDDRPQWPAAANSLAEFLERYLEALGDKYWDQTAQ